MTMMGPDNYYDMNFWQQMLGMAGNPYYQYYQAPKMQYMGNQQGQGQQQKQGGGMNPNMLRQLMASQPTQTGMTPNATNSMGESYYGWGAQTGDWGATAGATPGSATVGNGLVAGNEIPLSGMGADLGGSVGAEAGGIGAEAGSAGGGSYLGYVAPVLAAIAGQHMMSSATDRRTMEGGKQGADVGKGHRTGDVFSGDFFTEPWMAFAQQKLGVDTPTPGEKTDAAMNSMRQGEGGAGDLLGSIPGTALQWFDPFGTISYNFLEDKFGKEVATVLIPHMGLKNVTDWFSGLF